MADKIQFPLNMSQEIAGIFKELNIKAPKKSFITNICADDAYGEERRILYSDIRTLIKAVNTDYRYNFPRVDDVDGFREKLACGKYNSLFEDSKLGQKITKKHGHVIKPGRFLKKLLPDINDKIVEKFAASILKGVEISIVDNVTDVYRVSPPHSCMTGRSMEFYEKNDIKIAVGYLQGNLVCRALVWPDVYFPKLDKRLTYLDRRYDTDGRFRDLLKLFGKSRGMVVREFSERSEGEEELKCHRRRFIFDDKPFEDEISFDVRFYKVDFVPWQDTFAYAVKNKDIVKLCNWDTKIKLRSVHGENPLWEAMVFCGYLGEEIPKRLATRLTSDNEDWALIDDVEHLDEGVFLKTECVECEVCHNRFHEESNFIHPSSTGNYICKKDGKEIQLGTYKGMWATPGKLLNIYGKWLHIDDVNVLVCNDKELLLATDNDVYEDWLSPPTFRKQWVTIEGKSGYWQNTVEHNYFRETQTPNMEFTGILECVT